MCRGAGLLLYRLNKYNWWEKKKGAMLDFSYRSALISLAAATMAQRNSL